jgi:HlyD family secretion protein
MVGGSSVITWVIEDGSMVKKGDVLCRLDSADYEELVRQQEIKNERARADLRTAQLNHDVARTAVDEFRKGLMAQTIQEQEVALTLAESEVARGKDRLDWLNRMKVKGYASQAQVAAGESTLRQAELNAKTARWNLDNFRKFGAPKQVRTLEAAVESAQAELIFAEQRMTRFQERLDYYKKMVDNCTIRAPHDGFVIYVPPKFWSSEPPIEPGSRVRQSQDLFYLPDLSRMRVAAMIHESIVTRVQPGMTVRARIEGLSGRQIEGHVLEIEPLPDTQSSWMSDARSFKATIALDSSPRGIRPEMSAEVEVDIDRRINVVAVPVESVAVEDGKEYCYVAADGLLERRPVKLGGSNPDLLEVTEGVEEGEEVVSDVSQVEAYASLVIGAPATERDDPRPTLAESPRGESAVKVGF